MKLIRIVQHPDACQCGAEGYRAAFAEFVKELAKHVPHEGATAWFECSNRGHRVFWIPFKGHVTETRLGRDGYSKVPAAGVWLLQDGPEGFMPDRIEAR